MSEQPVESTVEETVEQHDDAPTLDVDTFDVDAWIDGATRTAETVPLYAKGHLNNRLRQIERRISEARLVPAGERSVTDESPEALEEEWAQVAQELTESALPVKVQALTQDELDAARAEAKKAKAKDADVGLYVVAAGCVSPKLTVEQLRRLRQNAGDAGVAQLALTVMRLSNETVKPSAPFSRTH